MATKNEPAQPEPVVPEPDPTVGTAHEPGPGPVTNDATSPAIEALDPRQVEVNKLTSTPDEDDARHGPVHDTGDPKDNPVLPDDVSAIADPEDPMTIMDPGEDPDFGGRRGGTPAKQ